MNKSRNCSSRVEHKKTIIFNALQRIQFLMLYEFQDYLLKSMNLYALYMLYSKADHKALHRGCCSSPRSTSDIATKYEKR